MRLSVLPDWVLRRALRTRGEGVSARGAASRLRQESTEAGAADVLGGAHRAVWTCDAGRTQKHADVCSCRCQRLLEAELLGRWSVWPDAAFVALHGGTYFSVSQICGARWLHGQDHFSGVVSRCWRMSYFFFYPRRERNSRRDCGWWKQGCRSWADAAS